MTNQITPIGAFNFVLSIPDVDPIGAFWHCEGLSMRYEVFEYAEGGNNDFVYRLPGRMSYPNLTLSRGLTNEDAMTRWFLATQNDKPDMKEITLTISGGATKRIFTFADAFPVAWTGPQIDINNNTVA